MDRRTLRAFLCAAACSAALPATASAQSITDLNDWNLTESVSAWGGGTQFHMSSSGDGTASFRWIDSPNKTTVISGNTCSDLVVIGQDSIGAGDTNYHYLFSAGVGACFVLRGRTAIGSGSMVNHDGRLKR